ncbi:MAG: hypothetical protein WB507_02025 [Solirubrobacterales bacterium]
MTHRSPSSSGAALAITTALVTAFSLALMATPAMATKIHVLSKTFILPESAGPLEPAINQSTGVVYISSYGSSAVYAFEEPGVPAAHPQLTKADGTTPYPFVHPYGVAVDNSTGPNKGDIYVADYNAGDVVQFNPSGSHTSLPPITALSVPKEGTEQTGGLPPILNNRGLDPTGVAVASDGDVYVADQSNNVIDVFEPNGMFVSQLGAGHVSGANAIAFGDAGDLYVAQNASGLIELDQSGACVNSCASIDPAANLGVAVDAEGNVYADEGATISEFTSSGEALYSFGGLSFGRGIAFDEATGSIWVADEGAGNIDIFKSIAAPSVEVEPLHSSTPTSATLSASVDPAGAGDVTACTFEYGTEKGNYSLGTIPCLSASPPNGTIGTPSNPIAAPIEIHGDLPGLHTLTTYHYRIVASNAQGTIESPDHTFTLLPNPAVVSQTSASTESSTAATVTAEINPEYGATVYRFQYGTTDSYGSSTLIGPVGADGINHLVTAHLTNLIPGSVYHYRVVAINYVGTTQGPDETFTTPAQPAVAGGEAGSVTATTATLEAQVNPKFAATTYHFEYGPELTYGGRTPESASIGSDGTSHTAKANLTSLTPETDYHFRVVATNPFGTTTGPDQTFTTATAPIPSLPPKSECRKGLVKRHGRCVKKIHHKPRHTKHGGKR